MQTASTPLESLIHDRVRAAGALTFAEYMDLALYHPQFGYYTSGKPKVGWAGDFFTSPHLTALFGACIARQLMQMWEKLARPRPFRVVEQGAGQGLLAAQVQAFAREHVPALAEALEYQAVDVGQPLIPDPAQGWGVPPVFQLAGAGPHVLLSNELIDAFPVHLVETRGGRLYELFVVERDGRLIEQPGEPSSEEVAGYLDRFKVPWRSFGDGWRAEISLRALEWMRGVAARLAPGGFVLTIDYGDLARKLYTRQRRRGTLLCYFHHMTNEEPLARPGRQDMTAHVNFSALIEEGRRVGLRRSRFTTQREFLLGWGIGEDVEALRRSQFGAAETARHTDQGQTALLRLVSLRNAVSALLDPGGLGGFRVLIQHHSKKPR
jgi:SAM-dependent MidA family methyltransferase